MEKRWWTPGIHSTWKDYFLHHNPSTLPASFLGKKQVIAELQGPEVTLVKFRLPKKRGKRYLGVLKTLCLEEGDVSWHQYCMEVQNTRKMSHRRGFPRYLGHFTNIAERRGYIVVGYVAGPTLTEVLEDPLVRATIKDWGAWVRGVVRRLLELADQCHASGIVHRDIKPDNIMLRNPLDPNTMVLIDFGLSSWVGIPWQALLDHGVGTCHYLPREALRRERVITPHRDIHAVGAVLYQMCHPQHLTPHETFLGEDVAAVARRILEEEPPLPNPGLRAVPWAQHFFAVSTRTPAASQGTLELLQHPLVRPPRQATKK